MPLYSITEMKYITGFILFVIVIVVQSHDEDPHSIQYNADNFSEEIIKNNHFVMFYAPWCGHCQRLTPTWSQLAEMLNEEDSNIRIAKVDCTTDNKICNEQDVTGYPTLIFYKSGGSEAVKFRGTRDLPSLTLFINEQLRSADEEEEMHSNIISVPIKGLLELTEETFEKHVATGKHFVKFYAPWCGHCQKLAPVWEQLAQSLESEPEVSVSKLDCTLFRPICNQFDIKGYPTLLWIEDGKKTEKFQGERTHEELKAYVNSMLGNNNANVDENKAETITGSVITILNGEDFLHGIESGIAFVKFFAPWCGHCKRLAPTWEELAKKFADNSDVKIVKVDCTLEINKKLCQDEEADGFPTIFLYKNGKKISEYTGDRSLEDLHDFVGHHLTVHDEL